MSIPIPIAIRDAGSATEDTASGEDGGDGDDGFGFDVRGTSVEFVKVSGLHRQKRAPP